MRRVVSYGGVKAISLQKKKVLESARDAARILKERLGFVKEVYLFGSLVKGTHHGLSDADFIVVVSIPMNPKNFWKIYGPVHDTISEAFNLSFDLLVLDEETFEKNKDAYKPLMQIA